MRSARRYIVSSPTAKRRHQPTPAPAAGLARASGLCHSLTLLKQILPRAKYFLHEPISGVPYNAIPKMDKKRYTFWIDVRQAAALKRIKARDGVPESEQLRRAIAKWIVAHDGGAIRVAQRPSRRRVLNDRQVE